jgi:hypothetical protein
MFIEVGEYVINLNNVTKVHVRDAGATVDVYYVAAEQAQRFTGVPARLLLDALAHLARQSTPPRPR